MKLLKLLHTFGPIAFIVLGFLPAGEIIAILISFSCLWWLVLIFVDLTTVFLSVSYPFALR